MWMVHYGHLVYLCTGRSKAELYDFIMEIRFDDVIGLVVVLFLLVMKRFITSM